MARIADGSLHVDVEATYGLEDIKTALDHASREARSGKVLITPNGPLAEPNGEPAVPEGMRESRGTSEPAAPGEGSRRRDRLCRRLASPETTSGYAIVHGLARRTAPFSSQAVDQQKKAPPGHGGASGAIVRMSVLGLVVTSFNPSASMSHNIVRVNVSGSLVR